MNLRTLTVTEASKETGLSGHAIRKLLHEGQLAGPRIGRNWRVSVASLEAFVARTQAPPVRRDERAFPEVEDHFA